jgi:hypothetical protein
MDAKAAVPEEKHAMALEPEGSVGEAEPVTERPAHRALWDEVMSSLHGAG